MFGRPQESRRPVRTVTLDLPDEVGSVYDPGGDRPPIKAFGPLDRGEDISDMEPRVPSSVETDGATAKFTFDQPLGQGAWKIVVYQSRIRRADDGKGFELTDEDGNPWNSWVMQVLNPGPGRAAPDPGTRETKPQPSAPPARVFLDGEQVTGGASELSGEVLRADVHRPGTVEMEIDPLLDGARTSLYERYRTEMIADEEKERPHDKRTFRWASVGPIESFRWAHYRGTNTTGRLMLNKKELIYGTAVARPPAEASEDPLIDETTGTDSPVEGHPNTYKTKTITATPESLDVGIDRYQSPTLVAPETIKDGTNTPARNPRLYPDGVYFPNEPVYPMSSDGMGGSGLGPMYPDASPSSGSTDNVESPGVIPPGPVAVFDLPINCVLRLRVGGEVCWWGQTRLVPTLVSPRTAAQEIPGASASNPKDRARLQRDIWRASMEAVHLWGTPLPTDRHGNGVVVSTMRDFVLTAVAMGTEYEDGTQGNVSGQQGGHQFSAQSDRTLRRRKHRLAEMLKDQERNAPPMPEDHAPGLVAEVGSDAETPEYGRSQHSISRYFAELYDPTRLHRFQHEHQQRNLRHHL